MALLVVAGTHSRENQYSHAVAKKLLRHYRAHPRGGYTYDGEDGARRAKLWLLDELAIGIIEPISNKQSHEYLQKQEVAELVDLAQFWFEQRHSPAPSYTAEITDRWEWTSVTGPMISLSGADVMIDLHSNHQYTKGKRGRSMQINAGASRPLCELMRGALTEAKSEEPELYGGPYTPTPLPELRRTVAKRLFAKDDLLRIIDASQSDLQQNEREIGRRFAAFNDAVHAEWELQLQKADCWFTTEYRPQLPAIPDYFLFEAVHWGPQQQDATVRFITQYFLPRLQRLHAALYEIEL